MSRLQRSAVSFRRQGSSGRIWDDPLRSLDLKGPSTTAASAEASLVGDRSPRAASSRSFRRGGGAAADIPESPETTQGRQSPSTDGTPQERRAPRRRRRISSAFCACMGHPPASHAQQ